MAGADKRVEINGRITPKPLPDSPGGRNLQSIEYELIANNKSRFTGIRFEGFKPIIDRARRTTRGNIYY